jgi:CheY-like chemotaxis protein
MQRRVLIVDDEEDALAMLGDRLESAGYFVLKASDGKQAISIAREANPDLILLDIVMPEMDGIETSRVLHEDPATRNIPIVFLTCLVKKDEEKQREVIGGRQFLAKPYDSEHLLSTVDKYARKSGA